MNTKSIVLGGGCFWCIEAIYEQLDGVISLASGYAGGTAETANYRDVCSGTTDHVEVVEVTFDSEKISFSEILDVFWTVHDPTTPNRQGNDVGPQYRSAIFYTDEAEKSIAEESITTVASVLFDDPIVTELIPLDIFYKAETYHQDYYNKTGGRNPYCSAVISPKVSKFRKQFAHKLKTK